jgi:hypothetical protein
VTKGYDRDDIRRQLRYRHSSWNDLHNPENRCQRVNRLHLPNVDDASPTHLRASRGWCWWVMRLMRCNRARAQGALPALEDVEIICMLLSHHLIKVPWVSYDAASATSRRMMKCPRNRSTEGAKVPAQTFPPLRAPKPSTKLVRRYFRLRAAWIKRIRDRAKYYYAGDMKRKKRIDRKMNHIFLHVTCSWLKF